MLTQKDAILFKIVRTCAMTPKAAILFKIVHTCAIECLILKYKYVPRKFKRGIGSLFDPVLTLWGGGHIGSSRMEQSYCTSGFFRQRVTARNHSNYQPRPKRRSIIAYGKRENARHNKMRRSVRYVFLAVLRFPNYPGKGTAIFPFFIMFF